MRKNKKMYIWISILIFVCLLIVFNFDKIKFTFSMVNSYIGTNNDKGDNLNNGDIEDEEILNENPLLEIIGNNDDNNSTDEDFSNNDNEENSSEDGKADNKEDNMNRISENGDSKDNVKNDSKNEKDNYIQIISNYNSEFDSMRSDYEAKLDSLINSGYKEYKSGEISTSKLSNKYISKGSKLEQEADNNFNNLIKNMEQELKSNDHNANITKDLKTYYKNYKSSTKSKFMNKINNHL